MRLELGHLDHNYQILGIALLCLLGLDVLKNKPIVNKYQILVIKLFHILEPDASSTNSTNEDWLQLLNFDGHFFGLLALHVFVNKIDIF